MVTKTSNMRHQPPLGIAAAVTLSIWKSSSGGASQTQYPAGWQQRDEGREINGCLPEFSTTFLEVFQQQQLLCAGEPRRMKSSELRRNKESLMWGESAQVEPRGGDVQSDSGRQLDTTVRVWWHSVCPLSQSHWATRSSVSQQTGRCGVSRRRERGGGRVGEGATDAAGRQLFPAARHHYIEHCGSGELWQFEKVKLINKQIIPLMENIWSAMCFFLFSPSRWGKQSENQLIIDVQEKNTNSVYEWGAARHWSHRCLPTYECSGSLFAKWSEALSGLHINSILALFTDANRVIQKSHEIPSHSLKGTFQLRCWSCSHYHLLLWKYRFHTHTDAARLYAKIVWFWLKMYQKWVKLY